MIDITTGLSVVSLIIIVGAMLLPIWKKLDTNGKSIIDKNASLTIIKTDISVMGKQIEYIEKSIDKD